MAGRTPGDQDTSETGTPINSRYKGYCGVCHFTIFKKEKIVFDGQPRHINCAEALQDTYRRELDPRYLNVYGELNKKKLSKLLREKEKKS